MLVISCIRVYLCSSVVNVLLGSKRSAAAKTAAALHSTCYTLVRVAVTGWLSLSQEREGGITMGLKSGEQITYCLIPGMQRYTATIQSIDNAGIALQLFADSPAALPLGQYVMITEMGDDVDYYCEVAGREGATLRLKRVWTGKRGYFRVDDVFPVMYRSVAAGQARADSRIYSGFGADVADLELTDETISPRLWKMLADINTKLGLILEHLHLENEGLNKAESMPVNISASGLRFSMPRKTALGDVIEVKMLLPTNPAVGILCHGKVVRVDDAGKGAYATSLHFIDLIDDVRDVIIQYTLKRQREIVRRHREQDQNA